MNKQEAQYRSLTEQGIHFPSAEESYITHLKNAQRLPKELQYLQHTFPWPIDMSNPDHGITCYKGDNNYVSQEDEFDEHFGIDVQLPINTRISSPISGVVFDAGYGRYSPDPRGMMDIEIYDPKTGIDMRISHLQPNSIPNRFMNPHKRKHGAIPIQLGDYVGTVGEFFNKTFRKIMKLKQLPNPKRISPDSFERYGRTYNHIHIEADYFPDRTNFENDRYYYRNFHAIDPIQLFQRLY